MEIFNEAEECFFLYSNIICMYVCLVYVTNLFFRLSIIIHLYKMCSKNIFKYIYTINTSSYGIIIIKKKIILPLLLFRLSNGRNPQ